MKFYLGCLIVCFFAGAAHAAIPGSKILYKSGATFGGISGKGFTLMDLQTAPLKVSKNVERLIIDVGNIQGQKLTGLPGYYHAELRQNPDQLIIDFAQMPNSKMTAKEMMRKLSSSKAILKSKMSLDPADNTLNLTFDLRKNTKVRVYQVAGKKTTSKVVVDFKVE